MREILFKIRQWLSALSFRTGLWVLGACAVCYIVSFAQALLPIPLAWKGGLWIAFFGMAKALQYTGLLILGKEGWKRLKAKFRKNKVITE